MDLGLGGKLAVITGGSVGIGLGVARAFAREGAQVLIAARDAGRAAEAAAGIAAEFGTPARAHACDVATAEGCASLVAAAAGAGGADILVNNAGTGSNETIIEAPDAKWQAYWDLHVMAAVRLARGLVPQMEARGGGAILNNASICAVQPLWYEPIYNVTKSALMMLSKTMATEFIPKNIRVNCINPGLIRTPDWEKTARQLSGEGWEGYLQSVADEHAAIRRFGTVEELADFFVFLCSPRASYSVGSTYFVDGGMLRTV
jgi:NAD(P)-dependent dehydrogenase (short-subunit alcohol dehydrogenase family)